MTKVNSTVLILIGILAVFVFYWRECRTVAPVVKNDSVVYKIIYIPVHDTVEVDKPFPFEVIEGGRLVEPSATDTVFITLPTTVIDTFAIVMDYFKVRRYADTIHTAYGTVTVSREVTQNKERNLKSEINLKFTDTTKTVSVPVKLKNQVYFGIGAGSNGQQFGFGPGAIIRTKREHIYGVYMDYLPGVSKPLFFQVQTAWKIHISNPFK